MGFLGDIANIGTLGVLNPGGSGPVGNIGADVITGGAVSNNQATNATNVMQMQLADKQMAFQKDMSNTAYQRAMADMKSAGLNPMLAFEQGGASTPSGAMASLTAPRPGDIGAGLANSAKTLATEIPNIAHTNSQTALNKSQATVADVSAKKITANAKESEANTQYTQQLARKAEADTRTANANATMAEQDKDISTERFGVDKATSKAQSILEKIENAVGAFTGARGVFQRGQNSGPRRPLP